MQLIMSIPSKRPGRLHPWLFAELFWAQFKRDGRLVGHTGYKQKPLRYGVAFK